MSIMVYIDPIGIRFPNREVDPKAASDIIEKSRHLSTFLLMLSLLVFNNVRHSILVLKAKSDRQQLKGIGHMLPIGLMLLIGITVGISALSSANILFLIFAGVSILSASSLFYYIFKSELKKNEWLLEHLGNIIGSGIGAYTAFFAFGGRRFLAEVFTGQMQIIPWVLPTLIGIIATYHLTKKYRQKYRVA